MTNQAETVIDDVIIMRINQTLHLKCEIVGHDNYIIPDKTYTIKWSSPAVGSNRSTIKQIGKESWFTLRELRQSDAGPYVCSILSTPVQQYVAVRKLESHPRPAHCSPLGFVCSNGLCVLPAYVCDGFIDCDDDETVATCGTDNPCRGKRPCSKGRCIPHSWCCDNLKNSSCIRPDCCDEPDGLYGDYPDMEFSNIVEDNRHYNEDYGFIQTTIYTITACALIFMIAVVLLVSAICKMHIKRTTLRNYANAQQHFGLQCGHNNGLPRYPGLPPHGCFEANRLLEPEYRVDATNGSPQRTNTSANNTPTHRPNLVEEIPECETQNNSTTGAEGHPVRPTNFGFGRLANSIFNSRYSQVPQQCYEVEMTSVLNTPRSPNRTNQQFNVANYRSPTYCGVNNGEYYFANNDTACFGPDLNYMSARYDQMDFYISEGERRRALRRANAVERILDRIGFNTSYRVNAMERNFGADANRNETVEESHTVTLQLGRFQLNLPSFGRSRRADSVMSRLPVPNRRPDTPNVAEVNLDELDFVRLNSNDTYTLNGRTIRLLGGNFENYPPVMGFSNQNMFVGGIVSPPPYSEAIGAVPLKIYGPPPAYLSRENLTSNVQDVNEITELPAIDGDVSNGNLVVEINVSNTLDLNSQIDEACALVTTVEDVNGNADVNCRSAEEVSSTNNIELPPCYEEVSVTSNNGNTVVAETRDLNGNSEC